MRKILVTTGLPYANGSLHLGHVLEQIQADVWVRWQKILGVDCLFVCGDDAHGTPIMLSAQEKGITPEELITGIKLEHEKDSADFYIDFDNYHTTHSKENLSITSEIYKKLKANGDIVVKTIDQAFDTIKEMFLPDRFIKGTCPCCKTENQYGDNCENCGSTYNSMDLINPVSTLSGTQPIKKPTLHYFFHLPKYAEFLQHFLHDENHLQKEIAHKLDEWFKSGLKDWDISRDAPYFGFEIPDAPGKYFYVWLDAPIGYIASFKNLCEKRPEIDFDTYWKNDSKVKLYHFVGKDVVYFHALFWPAVLKGANLRLPDSVFTHGFVTVNGRKMSKSRGNFITARSYLDNLEPEYLRYYFTSKLSDTVDDLDFNITDFVQRVNSDLIGKVVNIASRSAGFITKNFDGNLASSLANEDLFNEFVKTGDKISDCYIARKYSEAVREIMRLADLANQYIDAEKPWVLVKDPATLPKTQLVATMGLNLFRLLVLYLKPILPKTALESEEFLNISPLVWQDREKPLLNHDIKPFKPLMQRILLESAAKLTE